MAKKASPRRRMGRPPVENPKRTVVTIRGSDEWREWINEAAKHCRMPTVMMIDHAVVKFVQEQGFKKPPPER